MNHRAAIEGILDPETNSYALKPVEYCNWFFDGKPSPLRFGIGTMTINSFYIEHYFVSDEKPRAVLRVTGVAGLLLVVGGAALGRATGRTGK